MRFFLRNPVILGVLGFVFICTCARANLFLHYGQDSFNVSVRNDHFKDISNAQGHVYISGNMARIEVTAPGYRRGSTNVWMNQNTHNYYTDVRLQDPFVTVDLTDNIGANIPNAYLSNFSQSMYWGDEYGIRGDFPKEGFEKLSARDFDIRVDYMYAFSPRVYLTDRGTKWAFEVIVRRRDMGENFVRIRISVPRDPESGIKEPSIEPDVISLVKDYVENQKFAASLKDPAEIQVVQNRLESLALRIRLSYSNLDEGERFAILSDLSSDSPLKRELQSISTFESFYSK